MSKKLTLHGKSIEVSDEDYDACAHLGAEIGIALTNSILHSESGRQLQQPSRGHAPRLTQETRVAKSKETAADQVHNVVQRMRELRGQR